jgi:hypothetical protein
VSGGGGRARGLRSAVRVDDRFIRTGVRGSVSRVPRGGRPSTRALVSRPPICFYVPPRVWVIPKRRTANGHGVSGICASCPRRDGPFCLASQRSEHRSGTDDVTTLWAKVSTPTPTPTLPPAAAPSLRETIWVGTHQISPDWARAIDQRSCLRPRKGMTGVTGPWRRVHTDTV